MPLLIVFWIPGVGPFTLISRFVQRLAGFYAPILFMTLPVALLLRLGELPRESFSLSLGGLVPGCLHCSSLLPHCLPASDVLAGWRALFFRRSSLTACLSAVPNSGSVVCVTGRRAQPTAAGTLAWRGQACGEQRQSTTAGQQSIASPQRRVTSESGTESTPIRIR